MRLFVIGLGVGLVLSTAFHMLFVKEENTSSLEGGEKGLRDIEYLTPTCPTLRYTLFVNNQASRENKGGREKSDQSTDGGRSSSSNIGGSEKSEKGESAAHGNADTKAAGAQIGSSSSEGGLSSSSSSSPLSSEGGDQGQQQQVLNQQQQDQQQQEQQQQEKQQWMQNEGKRYQDDANYFPSSFGIREDILLVDSPLWQEHEVICVSSIWEGEEEIESEETTTTTALFNSKNVAEAGGMRRLLRAEGNPEMHTEHVGVISPETDASTSTHEGDKNSEHTSSTSPGEKDSNHLEEKQQENEEEKYKKALEEAMRKMVEEERQRREEGEKRRMEEVAAAAASSSSEARDDASVETSLDMENQQKLQEEEEQKRKQEEEERWKEEQERLREEFEKRHEEVIRLHEEQQRRRQEEEQQAEREREDAEKKEREEAERRHRQEEEEERRHRETEEAEKKRKEEEEEQQRRQREAEEAEKKRKEEEEEQQKRQREEEEKAKNDAGSNGGESSGGEGASGSSSSSSSRRHRKLQGSMQEPWVSLITVWNREYSVEMIDMLVISAEIAADRACSPVDAIIAVIDRPKSDALLLCSRDLKATILWFPHHGTSIAVARKVALGRARGRRVVFGEPGDYYAPGWLKHGREAEMQGRNHDISRCDIMPVLFWNVIDSRNGYLMPNQPVSREGYISDALPEGLPLRAGSFAIRRDLLMAAGGYPLHHREVDDAEVFRSMIAAVDPHALSSTPAEFDPNLKASYVFWSNSGVSRAEQPTVPPRDSHFLSVIIAAGGDRAKLLRVMLLAMQLQTFPVYEIIVVKGGDDYGQVKMMQKFFSNCANLKYLEAEAGEYGHAARDVGLKASSGDWVLITNDDNYYAPTFVETMLTSIRLRQHRGNRPGVLFFSMVHDYDVYMNYRIIITAVAFGEIDMGSAIVEGGTARDIGYNFREKNSDYDYLDTAMKRSPGGAAPAAFESVLFVHN